MPWQVCASSESCVPTAHSLISGCCLSTGLGSAQLRAVSVVSLSPSSWHQGEMILYLPELSGRCSQGMQCWPRGVGAMWRGAVYSPISSYLITVPRLAFSSKKGKQKRGAGAQPRRGVGRKAGSWISRGDAGPFLYIPTKVKRSMGGRTQQIRLRLSPTFPKIFAKGEEGKLIGERLCN